MVKKYWVAKLKDNNCWMTQNLDLDIPSGGFSSDSEAVNTANSWALSDMTAAWTSPTAGTSTTISAVSQNYTQSRSWDQGIYVLSRPTMGTNCNNTTAGQGLSSNGCKTAGFLDVSDWTPSDEPEFTAINNSPIDENNKIYDAHYLVGNYYQWNAVVAGSGNALQSSAATIVGMKDAQSSICPKGWKLPSSGGADGNKTFNQEGSFGALLSYYGWNGSVNSAGSMNADVLVQSPLFFVRSGYVHDSGYVSAAGYQSRYWSSTAYTNTNNAYDLSFMTNKSVEPATYNSRYNGFSVRCIAR